MGAEALAPFTGSSVHRGLRLPRALPCAATIGVCAPSGRVDEAALALGISYLEGRGHRVVLPGETRHAWRYFAGTDDERLAGFHALVDDPAVDMVMAARGGYGLSRLLPHIDWARVGASGKAFVGFSDFTAFNLAAHACASLVTYHGPMVAIDLGHEGRDEYAERQFWGAVSNPSHRLDAVQVAHGYGAAEIAGPLWGGNLSLLGHLVGTPYFPEIAGGILYVEEVAEEPYAIERLFMQLHHAGVLGRQRALVLGDFTDCEPKNPARYPYCMAEVLETLRELLPYPVLTGLPLGHIARKATLPFGAPGHLSLREGGYTLSFSGHNQPR